ncbi:hypothetical protein [Methanothermobacter thermautotrophicus]|jgi:hypothetical protein|uniref:Uncharacterized protein n=1 Tax=Methanothermobacter thermautotrophicus TaxID=145262 RepID=A0A7J4MXM1_METTF|nr:hypothetical protein [Methanothermobacter sp.]HIH65499.1 hypothetical protein [Methanothermobacter thermautotrophicus]
MTAVTWTWLYYSSFLEDLEKTLEFLMKYNKEEGSAIKSDFQSILPKRENRDSILQFMEEINLVGVMPSRRTSRYSITEEGRRYLQSENRPKYLHRQLYKHVLHYSYFYNYILENEFYQFSKLQIIEKMVLNSSYDFGVRIFDWKSAENVLKLMVDLGVLSLDKENDIYSVNREYQTEFNHKVFEELIIDRLSSDTQMFTKDLCSYLLSREGEFINSDDEPTIRMIYKHLLRVNESKDILKFIPGLPRPPIPSKHTLVELRRG